ncbi:MAG TPA: M28 family peptidase [Crenalkalicoccus sp.]|jgi:Zn-dependent M28 family amino/carboxypeptidase|nr:M28 family peptidase [Crenalkalicoccus sp.]
MAAMLQQDIAERVLGRIWASPRIAEDFHAICATGGRFAGTESEARATSWLARRLAGATGRPVQREPIPYRGWTRGPASVHAAGRAWPAQALGRSPATPAGGLTARLLDLGRGTPAEIAAAGEAVRGAILLVRHEFMLGTGHMHRRRKYEAARAAGAAGFLIACHEPGLLPVTGSAGDGGPGNIPCAGLSAEAGAALAALSGQAVTLETSGRFADRTADNLLSIIEGQGPELVVLSAHIDGHDLAASAMDNASGLACALAVAEAVRDIVPGLARGVQVALFNIEEWALLGSAAHLAALPEEERARRVLNVNLDSVAGAESLTALTSGAPGIAPFLRAALAPCGLHLAVAEPFFGNSDHANFLRHGIPALRLAAGFDQPASNLRFLLTPADTPDKVTAAQLKHAAGIATLLVLAACATPAPPVPRMDAATARRVTTPPPG